ncbi:hypothetical protein [Maribacter sp. 4G9]|uniref:hypothetical protein n=1 Tax=Maribacter sp. 4G9 TaxID=1889777 RepID=UPI000C14A960|nr:hypothetical protein [Maribacter sp. 4G9]PIB39225.1 hypothetical protein BFP75_12670 [Maribacter sp. 4G9]
MDKKQIIRESTIISAHLDQIATTLFKTAKKLYAEGKIGYGEYNGIYTNYYQPIIGYASKVVMDDSITLVDGLEGYLKEIKSGTATINKTIEKINSVKALFNTLTSVLSTAASVATFVVTPNPASFYAVSSSIAHVLKSFDELS